MYAEGVQEVGLLIKTYTSSSFPNGSTAPKHSKLLVQVRQVLARCVLAKQHDC